MSSNPFAEIRAALVGAIQAGVPDAKWCAAYDGEDWDDKEYQTIRQRMVQGPGVYVRLPRTETSGEAGIESLDHQEIMAHLIVCAPWAADRGSAAEYAEQLAWDVYQAVRAAGRSPASMHEACWRLVGFAVEWQGSSSTIMSVMLRNSADFADWTASA